MKEDLIGIGIVALAALAVPILVHSILTFRERMAWRARAEAAHDKKLDEVLAAVREFRSGAERLRDRI